MRDAIATLLSADATLLALLTGGIYGDADEISRQGTPAAFDADGELRPCLLITDSTLTPDASAIPGAARHVLRLFFYQPAGVAVIAAARARVYALLYRQRVTVSALRVIELSPIGDTLGQRDDALNCPLELSRWEAALIR
jgi:hypothetical protein